jgi:Flp pilus assembly protein TadD
MKARQAIVCPSCGAQNRPTWEFCARCNESLAGVTLTDFAGPVEEAARPDEASAPGDSSFAPNAILLITVLALGLLAAAGWRYAATAPPLEGGDPALFTIPSTPPDIPSPSPSGGQGAADFEAGRRALNVQDFDQATALLGAAVSAEPDNPEYRNVLGHALWRAGDKEAALVQHAEAARLDPRLRMQYARSLDVAGRGPEAMAEYEAILAQNPATTIVQEDLGRLLFRSGQYARAASHLQAAAKERPDDPVLQQELAYALEQAGDRKSAETAYRGVLQKAPEAAISRGLLADNLLEQGRRDEAVALLQEGLRITPDVPLLQRQLGSVLERTGQGASAAEAYRAYVRLAPNAPDAKDVAARAARLEAGGSRR